MRAPRVLLLTSTFPRHRFVANTLTAALPVVGVWQEEKSFVPQRYAMSARDETVINGHFAARDAAEARDFATHSTLHVNPAEAAVRSGAPGCINDPNEQREMAALRPDVVAVFGTGLLGAAIIERFAGRIINLHLGLSPYYRGAGTNFWPLVNRAPEFVGATVHYLDAGIDTGPLIAHARPDLHASDGPHDVGNRAIVAGAAALVQAIHAHARSEVDARPQRGSGCLYQRKDFSAAAVSTLHANFASGMIAEYLADKPRRDAALSLLPVPVLA